MVKEEEKVSPDVEQFAPGSIDEPNSRDPIDPPPEEIESGKSLEVVTKKRKRVRPKSLVLRWKEIKRANAFRSSATCSSEY